MITKAPDEILATITVLLEDFEEGGDTGTTDGVDDTVVVILLQTLDIGTDEQVQSDPAYAQGPGTLPILQVFHVWVQSSAIL